MNKCKISVKQKDCFGDYRTRQKNSGLADIRSVEDKSDNSGEARLLKTQR